MSILPLPYGRRRREAQTSRRARRVLLLAILGCFAVVGVATAAIVAFDPFGNEQVEGTYANGVLLPTNQWISPLGSRVFEDNTRLITSSISPNGQYLATLAWNDYHVYLTMLNLITDTSTSTKIANGIPTGVDPNANDDTTVSPDGPLWSPDGSTIWVPQTDLLAKFSFNPAPAPATQTDAIWLCGQRHHPAAAGPDCNTYGPGVADGSYIPSGMALSPDGSKLYVAFNGANTLGVIDTATDTLINQIQVGNAPRQVVISADGNTAYVSNEGGRPANTTDFTNLSDGTPIVSSPVTGAAITGTVSVVNLTTGTEVKEIPVGLQPTALYQDGSALFVANSNDDSDVGHQRADKQRRPDGHDQPGPRRERRQLRQRDQHGRPQHRARQRRPRQRDRRLPLRRPLPADAL